MISIGWTPTHTLEFLINISHLSHNRTINTYMYVHPTVHVFGVIYDYEGTPT